MLTNRLSNKLNNGLRDRLNDELISRGDFFLFMQQTSYLLLSYEDIEICHGGKCYHLI